MIASGKIFQAAFTVIIPSKNGGKSKERQTNHQQNSTELFRERQTLLKSVDGDIDAFKPDVPGFGDDDGKTRHRTNDDGVDKSPGHGDQPLTHAGFCLSGSRGNRRAPKAGLVGKNPPGNPLLHRDDDGTQRPAGNGTHPESTLDNFHESRGHVGDMGNDDDEGAEDIGDSHERHNNFRYPSNAL